MRRSPAPKLKRPGPRVAAVRPHDPTARFSPRFRSCSGRFHSSLGNFPPKAYLTDLPLEGRREGRLVTVESGRIRRVEASEAIVSGSLATRKLSRNGLVGRQGSSE